MMDGSVVGKEMDRSVVGKDMDGWMDVVATSAASVGLCIYK